MEDHTYPLASSSPPGTGRVRCVPESRYEQALNLVARLRAENDSLRRRLETTEVKP